MKGDERSVISITAVILLYLLLHSRAPAFTPRYGSAWVSAFETLALWGAACGLPVMTSKTEQRPQAVPPEPSVPVEMDADNLVVSLCIQGMEAEAQSRPADASALFTRAWELRQEDYDACVAAHYVARHQPTPEDTLHWNQEALARALLAGRYRVRWFLPSLYLSLARSYEVAGDWSAAAHYYDAAAEHLDDVNRGRYGDVVRRRGSQTKG